MHFICGQKRLDLSSPVVMGVLNVTPDSFSDGGRHATVEVALEHALQMVAEGASIIDVGGESTRPGAAAVASDEEIERVVPVIEALAAKSNVVISIDTRKAAVARAAVEAGASMINDVAALRGEGMLDYVSRSEVGICLMHMQRDPTTMQLEPRYDDVVGEVKAFLAQRIAACERVGIERQRLLVDPGIGFGKRLEHNLELLKKLHELQSLGVPVLVGVSRKSMFQLLLGRNVQERLPASLAAAACCVLNGASVVRAHDVASTVDAVRIAAALRNI